MSATTTAAPQAPQPIGAIGRVIGVIFSPRATFEDIARKPSWLFPMVLLIVLNIAVMLVFNHRVGWRSMIEKQDEANTSLQNRMSQMTPEQREQMISQQTKIAPIIGYAGAVIGFPIVALVIAGILLGVFNAASGADLNFNTSLGVVTHAYMPGMIVALLGILIIFLKPPDQVDIQNLVASNLGALFSSDSPKWLTALGSSIDIFTFWIMGVMALGFSVARPKKISMGTALGWIIGFWALFVIIKVGITFAFAG